MEFYIVENWNIRWDADYIHYAGHILRQTTAVGDIIPCLKAGNTVSEMDCQNLKELMKNRDEILSFSLNISLGIWPNNDNVRDYIQIKDGKESSFMKNLANTLRDLGYGLKIKVIIEDFTATSQTILSETLSHNTVVRIVSDEVAVDEISCIYSNIPGAQLYYSAYWNKACWRPEQQYTYNGILTITGHIYPSRTGIFDSLCVSNFSEGYQRLLETEQYYDLTIITGDGSGNGIKCHRSILAAKSDVLSAMLGPSFVESKKGELKFDDMTAPGVRAFLAFLYCGKYEAAEGDCNVAFELFQAGHKYNIKSLEESMKLLLLLKPDNWFTVDIVVELYMYVKNIADFANLVKKAARLLRTHRNSLQKSDIYIGLKQDDPTEADLVNCIAAGTMHL